MLEIEMKFPVADFDAVVKQLQAWQAAAQLALHEADHYFNAPDRDFGRTDEAFRLRCVGANNRITYKGPKQGGPTKTRTEIEIGLESGADAAERFRQMAQHLGYRPVAVVRKQRICYDFARGGFSLQVCCDEVENLGRFVEVEIVTEAAERQRAETLLLEVVNELGLRRSEGRSYLEMVLARIGK
jgi:adenylate cyclase, class 2